MAITLPLFIFLPSFVLALKVIFLSEILKASFAKLNPPTIQFWPAIIFAVTFLFLIILVVMSPEGLRSS